MLSTVDFGFLKGFNWDTGVPLMGFGMGMTLSGRNGPAGATGLLIRRAMFLIRLAPPRLSRS